MRLFLIVASIYAPAIIQATQCIDADLILHRGNIYTGQTDQSFIGSIASKGAKITYVGKVLSDVEIACSDAEVINLNGKYSLVWTGPKDDINSLIDLDDSKFLIALQDHFGERVGNFKSCKKRIIFPLKQSFISEYPNNNIAIIGNSAQVMHPVAGQGLNTGIRDAFILADCIESKDIE